MTDGQKKLYWRTWIKSAAIRAVKTFAQTFGAGITVGAALSEIDWVYLASTATVALVLSIVTSLAGLPEVDMTLGIDRKEANTDGVDC